MAEADSTKRRRRGNDLTGETFGRWTVIRIIGMRKSGAIWLCACDCGTERAVDHSGLISGASKSCGCLRRELTRKRSTTHGMSRSSEHCIWTKMIQRCTNPSDKKYSSYGGRGIAVCESWRKSFQAFYADMGPRPSTGHSIERIDNDGDYSPENCRWATATEQGNNKRNNHMLTFDGRTMTLAQWDRERGFRGGVILYRLQHGWSIEEAITTPLAYL